MPKRFARRVTDGEAARSRVLGAESDLVHTHLHTLANEIEHLHNNDARLEKDMKSGFDGIFSELKAMREENRVNSKTQWGTLVPVFAIGVSLVWYLITIVISPINAKIMEFDKHATAEGHPWTVIAKVDSMERNMQAEIAAVRGETAVARDALEREIDTRLMARREVVDAQVQALREDINRIDARGSEKWHQSGLPMDSSTLKK